MSAVFLDFRKLERNLFRQTFELLFSVFHQKENHFPNFFVSLQLLIRCLRALWRDNDILESVIDALFLRCLNVGNSNLYSRTNAEVNATGVVYTPGVCRGRTMPSRTLFGCIIYWPAWVFILCSFLEKASDGRNTKRAEEDTPLFVCCLQ